MATEFADGLIIEQRVPHAQDRPCKLASSVCHNVIQSLQRAFQYFHVVQNDVFPVRRRNVDSNRRARRWVNATDVG